MRERSNSNGNGSKRGYAIRDGMTCTYTDIRDTLDAISKAHKATQAKKDRRFARQHATRNRGAR